jgi:membrane protein
MTFRDLVAVVKQTFSEWLEDGAPKEAAAVAYYAMLSVPALILLIQWILGQVVSNQAQQSVVNFIAQNIQGQGSSVITSLIQGASVAQRGGLAAVVSLATLAFSATTIVVHLEQSLNRIWEIAEENKDIASKIRGRVSSLIVVLFLGLFLLASVAISTAVSGVAASTISSLPVGAWALQFINALVMLLLLTVLFAATFKVLPNAIIAWRDTWLGAAITALLFIIGQYLLGLYLGKSAPGSAYGVAGSVVALMVWIYFSALILFLGAEFTQVYANRFGSHIKPDEDAISLQQKVLQEQDAPSREPDADKVKPEAA